eukprot:213604-Chlamydomonas_euryale.AAC.16
MSNSRPATSCISSASTNVSRSAMRSHAQLLRTAKQRCRRFRVSIGKGSSQRNATSRRDNRHLYWRRLNWRHIAKTRRVHCVGTNPAPLTPWGCA